MMQTVYAKYNNARCPRFATRTELLLDSENGDRAVRKTALTPEGQAHIDAFADKYAIVKKLYKDVCVIDVECKDGGACFPFVTGQTAGSAVEADLRNADDVVKRIKHYLRKIDTFADGSFVDFAPCKEFEEVFGEIRYQGPAVRCANVDEILDNFLITDDRLTLIDYEWVFDFPVPARYIQFRTVYYFYVKNHSILSQMVDEQEYMDRFGCPPEEVALWKQMEDAFQQYVHGRNRCYHYTPAYEKEIRDIHYLLNHVPDIAYDYNQGFVKDQKIRELRDALHPKNYPGYLWGKVRGRRGAD